METNKGMVIRLLIVSDLILSAGLLLGSLGAWFIFTKISLAFTLATISAILCVMSQLVVGHLIIQMTNTIDLQSQNAFERYFAQQENKSMILMRNKRPLIMAAVVLLVGAGIGSTMIQEGIAGTDFALYTMWAASVFALVFYGVHVDDMFAAISEQNARNAYTQDDTEEETPPWSM